MVVSPLLAPAPTISITLAATRSLQRRSLSVCYPPVQHWHSKLILADDAATAARKLKGDFPGSDKEAKKAGEEGYEAVRATAQQYVCTHPKHAQMSL